MNSRDTFNGAGAGIGFTGLLTILFIGLKLTGFISWSWWWVLSPLWGPAFLGLVALAIILALALGNTLRGQS